VQSNLAKLVVTKRQKKSTKNIDTARKIYLILSVVFIVF